jgi:glycerol uptake facilitator-like aquaporin
MTAHSNSGGIVEVSIAHGLVLAIFVTAFMNVAAHFNPAVTIGFLFTRRITPKLAGVHLLAQFAGAIVAAYLLKALYPTSVFDAARGGGQSISNAINGAQAWGLEAIATFFLMTAIYGTVVDKRSPNVGGFGVGLMLTAAIMTIGPLTGGSLNPARSFGPAMASGIYEAYFIYLSAPIVGAIVAALAYEHLVLKRDSTTA